MNIFFFRRTLRPPSPTTLTRARTPSRGVSVTPSERSVRSNFMPSTRQADMDHPELKVYLQKPRLVSTLGCGAVKPRTPDYTSEFHTRRLASNDRPAYRNLRLGGFCEGHNLNEGEAVPDILRNYYYDTYLNDSPWLNASNGQTTMPSPFHRGM